MIRALALTALLVLSGGAASAFTLVGKWQCDPLVDPEFTLIVDLHYRRNGTTRHAFTAAGSIPDGDLRLRARVFGTWTLTGSALAEEVKRTQLRSVSLDGKALQKGPLWDDLAKALGDGLADGSADEPASIQPVSDTAFRLIDGSVELTCRRPGARATS